MTAFSPAELLGRIPGLPISADKARHLRTLPCACGGTITADPRDPRREVIQHNESAWHCDWWTRAERKDWEE